MKKNKKKDYQLPVNGQLVAVSEEVYREFYRITEHGKYLEKKDSNNHITYYDRWNLERGNGVNCLPDTSVNVEKTVIHNFLVKKLMECLKQLKQNELEIIYRIYILGQTEAKVAKILNMSQASVNKKKKRILLVLRSNLKDFENFL